MLFYRDSIGREVDLILEQSTNYKLFEIKYSHTIRPDYFKHLKYLEKSIPIMSSKVIYAGDQQFNNVLNWRDLINM